MKPLLRSSPPAVGLLLGRITPRCTLPIVCLSVRVPAFLCVPPNPTPTLPFARGGRKRSCGSDVAKHVSFALDVLAAGFFPAIGVIADVVEAEAGVGHRRHAGLPAPPTEGIVLGQVPGLAFFLDDHRLEERPAVAVSDPA